MGFKSDGIRWKWDDKSATGGPVQYTTTTTDAEELKVKANKWKSEFIVNSPTTPAIVTYGWVCPKCGSVNAPWVSQCNCSTSPFVKVDTSPAYVVASPCQTCSNNPINGGSGNCNCILGTCPATC